MLSPSKNVKFTTMYPPVEFWNSMEQMQKGWMEHLSVLKNMTNTTNFNQITPETTTQMPLFPPQYPEPGSVASEINFGK